MSDIESVWSRKLGDVNVTEMRIDLLPDAKPFKYPLFREVPKTIKLKRADIDNQLKAGVIEPARSEWAAPVVFVLKKDDKLPFFIDYRSLNL